MMKEPTLSVIIPCFNNSLFLNEMLECCLRQSYHDWEVIVVDDGSTDDTSYVVNSFVKQDPRFRFFIRDREPKGSVTCRNIGLQHSLGKYIIHFDADDLVSETCFEKRVGYMEKHSELDYASFPAISFSNEVNIPKSGHLKGLYGIPPKNMDLLESFLRGRYSFSTWNNIYRKEAIKDVVWDENIKIYTDLSFIIPCILKGLKHAFCEYGDVDYYYRKGTVNAMTSSFVSNEKKASTLVLFERILNDISKLDDYKNRKKQFLGLLSMHYERLLFSRDKDSITDYCSLLSEYYSSLTVFRFKCIGSIVQKTNYNKLVIALLMTAILGDRKYLNEFRKRLFS